MNYSMIILTDSAIRDILGSYFTSVKSPQMDKNQTPQTPECAGEDRRAFLRTLAATIATCTTGLAIKVFANEVSDDTQFASLGTGASDDAQGSGIDDAQETFTIEDIEIQIADIQQKIEMLEADADNLTEEQWIELDEFYQRLAELENQQSQFIEQQIAEEKSETAEQEAVIEAENGKQEEQEVAIESKAETVQNIREINRFLDSSIRSQFSGIDVLLAPADPLVAKLKNSATLTQNENEQLEKITADTVSYLKQPHHRQELVAISRDLQTQSPQEYQAFKTFLISQDEAFLPIFEDIDAHIDDSFEATISAALPSAPDSGNLSSGFVSELDDGTQVKVESGTDGIVRSLDLAGTNYPIETDVQDVNLAVAERKRETVLNEIGPKKQITEYARQLIADNPDKAFAEIKDVLQSALSAEQFSELGIDGFSNRESAVQELDMKIQEYTDEIEVAQNTFRKIAQEAIRKTRESYERKDALVKQSLRLVYET